MLELDAQRYLAAGELIGQHRHGPPEHVGSGPACRDRLQASHGVVMLMWLMKASSI